MLKLIPLLTALLALAFSVSAQVTEVVPAPVGVAEIYLARDNGAGQAGEEATSFVTTDVPIYCVVQLDSSVPVTVRMNLVAVSVAGVKAQTRVVSTTYTTRNDENRVNFTGRPSGRWVPGRYRVDVFIGNKPVLSREFAVQPDLQAKPVTKPSNSKTSVKTKYAGPLKKS